MDDVKHHGRTFTDGVGTISPELAKNRAVFMIPSAHSTRLPFKSVPGVHKGMVSVDPRLVGTMMRLWPPTSPPMWKFHV
ncbi:hypothetical protein JB92DRAFT_2881503 [Gautieria morchelliformis]|nr:hypothetical protein JB92DRAFT_2881503 [Gautieria morchelliformis]